MAIIASGGGSGSDSSEDGSRIPPGNNAYFAGHEITQDEPGLENTLLEVILGTCHPESLMDMDINLWKGYISVTGTFSEVGGSPIGGPINLIADFESLGIVPIPVNPGDRYEFPPRPLTLTGTWKPVPECPFKVTNEIELTLTIDTKNMTMRMVGRTLSGTQCPCTGPCYAGFAAMGPFDVEVPLHPAECSYITKLINNRLGR
jgi:hypothetical protein